MYKGPGERAVKVTMPLLMREFFSYFNIGFKSPATHNCSISNLSKIILKLRKVTKLKLN
jgi:hypothetical protein